MPTAGRLFAAFAIAIVGYMTAEAFKPQMPEGTVFGFFSIASALIGLVVGWRTLGPDVSRPGAALGSALGVAIARIQPGELAEFPHRLIALAPEGSTRLSAGLFREPFAVCLGQEGAGVSPEMLALSHQTVSIPMKGKVESLNVAVAAGIVLACAAGALGG